MSRHHPPFMSVVICCYNGEKVIARAISSLLEQDYPRDRYEIIVVDDGSTDRTAEIIRKFPVRYVAHKHNQGIAAARNTGIDAVQGDVYVGFDDDCVVDPDWLRQLASGYTKHRIAGVSSFIAHPKKLGGIVDRFMAATGSGNPPSAQLNSAQGLWRRFIAYIRDQAASPQPPQGIISVRQINGASASFPIKILRGVGGWDPGTSGRGSGGVEDTDLCARISKRYPKYRFYAVAAARVVHDPKMNLSQLVRRQINRGPYNLKYYRGNGLIPPIFPFPLLWLASSITGTILNPWLGLIIAGLLPSLLYFWWDIRAVREHNPHAILFPYVQLAEELAALLGLAKGYLERGFAWPWSTHLVGSLIIGSWAAMVLGAPSSPARSVFSAIFLLLAPGYLLLRLIGAGRWPKGFWSTATYAAVLSLIILMGSGLAVNTLLPLFGKMFPLATKPLAWVIAIELLLAVIILAKRRISLWDHTPAPRLGLHEALLAVIGCILPILSIFGAMSLNNGGSNVIALTMLGLAACYALLLIWPRDDALPHSFAFGLFSISLSLLLATSLRGWYITGHDIIQEYQVFQLTSQHWFWNMNFYHDAYMACLSITILPTVLARLTGISDPYIYKILYQILFAFVPVIIYMTLSRYVSRRLAFLAAFVFISFPTFMVDMPFLGRQEAAFLCFALAFMTLLDTSLRRRQRSLLLILLLLGMILCHYSTSYVALGVIISAKVFELMYRIGAHFFKRDVSAKPVWTPIGWPIVGIMFLATYLWNTQITVTSTSIMKTVTGIATSLPRIVNHNTPDTGATAYSLLGSKATDDQLFKAYADSAKKNGRDSDSTYYSDAITKHYPAERAHETVDTPTNLGQKLGEWVPLYRFYDITRQGYASLLQVLMVLGVGLLTISALFLRLPRQYPIMGAAFLSVIALQVLLPSSVIDYGLLRLIQQGLLFLAFPVILASYMLLGLIRLRRPNWRERIIGVGFIAFFLILSGFLPALSGGYKPALATSNSGFYYDGYYTHAQELAGFAWLQQAAPPGSIVNADAFARRKMITYAGIYARSTMTPDTIAENGYVFLSYGNTTTGKLPLYANGTLLYQSTPTAFLKATKDLVYANNHIMIYR